MSLDDRYARARADARSSARMVRILLAQMRAALRHHERTVSRLPVDARPTLPVEDADALALAAYAEACSEHFPGVGRC